MVKSYDKAKMIAEKEGIRTIAELEDYVTELWAVTEWRQAASKNNATSLTKLRQRIRRYNKDFEAEIAEFKANPLNYSEEEKAPSVKDSESDEESESESGSGSDESEVKPKKKGARDSGDSDDSEEWDLTDSDESSSEEFDL